MHHPPPTPPPLCKPLAISALVPTAPTTHHPNHAGCDYSAQSLNCDVVMSVNKGISTSCVIDDKDADGVFSGPTSTVVALQVPRLTNTPPMYHGPSQATVDDCVGGRHNADLYQAEGITTTGRVASRPGAATIGVRLCCANTGQGCGGGRGRDSGKQMW